MIIMLMVSETNRDSRSLDAVTIRGRDLGWMYECIPCSLSQTVNHGHDIESKQRKTWKGSLNVEARNEKEEKLLPMKR